MARDCDTAGGPRVNLGDHIRKLWEDIGFKPASFTLPLEDEGSDKNYKPIADQSRFQRVGNTQVLTEEIEERIIGMTITNISLDRNDDDVRQFVLDYASKDIDIVRDIKKITGTISRKLNTQLVKLAMLDEKYQSTLR